MTFLTRLMAAFALVLGLCLLAAPARAQQPQDAGVAEGEEAGGEGASKGDPMYAYVGTAFIASAALFFVCKSARR